MADRVVLVRLEAKVDGAVAGFRKAKAAVDDMTKAASPTKAQAFDKLADRAAIAGVGIASAMGLAVKRFADFDQSMSAVQANSDATGKELENLRSLAVRLGADSQFSAKEAADGINEMAKAGVAVQDVMGGGLKGALDLAAAGQIGVAEAAETAATAMTQFKLDGSAVPHIADLLANAANKAQGGVGDMAAALQQAGLVASSTGLSIEETTAGLTAFASAGLIGSDAGTSFKTMLQRLSAPSGEAAQAMSDLGISAYDSQGNFVGLANVAGQLQTSLSKLTPAQRQAALATIFGSDAVRAANVLYEQGATGIQKWTEAVSEQGAAAKQAATLTDNLKGDLERLGGALDSVFIQTGSGANSGLRSLTQGLTGVVDAVGKIPGPVLLAGGALTSLALLAPKGVLKYREYKDQLDAVGLSLDKISTKAPRTGKALSALSSGVKAYAAALAVLQATTALTDNGDFAASTDIAARLGKSTDAVKEFDKAVRSAGRNKFAADDDVQSFGEAVKNALDPNLLRSAQDKVASLFGDVIPTSVKQGEDAILQLDAALAAVATSQGADVAKAKFDQFAAAAKEQGVSVDQLKAKLPQYAAALDAAASSAGSTSSVQTGLSENLQKVKDNADDARKAVDDYLDSLQAAGLVVLDSRAANREFEQSLDDVTERLNKRKELEKELAEARKASADTDRDGTVSKDEAKAKAEGIAQLKKELDNYTAGFDTNTQAGRDNQAALDKVAKSALDLAQARFDEKAQTGDLEGAEDAYRESLTKSRDSLIRTGVQMGLTKQQAKDYADQILKIPPARTTTATFKTVGLDALKTAGTLLKELHDKKVTLTIGRVGGVNAGLFGDFSGYNGGYTGPGGKYEVAGIVHRDEFVIRKESTQAIGKATLDYLNRYGRLPGHANGGLVGAAQSARPVPMQLAPAPAAAAGFGRGYLSGQLDMGNGLTGFVRGIVKDEMSGRTRSEGLASI